MAAFIEPQLATRATSLKESIWLRIGSLQLSMNDRDRSLDAFERVLVVNPANIRAMTQVGSVLAKKGSYSQAVAYLQRAISANAGCGEAWAVLAHCYLMTNDLPKAYQAYEKALNHLNDPCDPNLWYGIGVLYNRYGSHDNALEAFLAVLRLAPNFERHIEVCFYIGIIYKEQHKLDDAMKYFNKVSMVPNPPPPPLTRADVGFEIGHVHELKQDIPKALEMYKLALRENPHHPKTLQKLGWLEHFHKNNSREAISRLQMSLDADQNDAQTWYLLGRVFMALGDFRQAYNAYQQAVIRDGRNATFWCSIGVLYYQMNQYNDAMDAYSRAIKLNPSVSEVWFDLGTLYESCGQTIDAIDSYRRASELAPEKTQIRERLNVLQNSLNQGNPQQQQAQGQSTMPQPTSSLAALRQPHLQQQQPSGHPQQLPLPSQPMPALQQPNQVHPQSQSQSLPTQGPLPPVPGHSQALHALPNAQSQLQPLGIRPGGSAPGSHGIAGIGGQQQPTPIPIPGLSHPSATGHPSLPRHIMQHPLQQPPGGSHAGQGSTGFNQGHPPSHGLPANHLRAPLPHLQNPSQPTSQAQGPLSGATQRPGSNIEQRGPPGHSQPPRSNPLLQPLPQLPALPRTAGTNATHPGSVKPGEAPPTRDSNTNQQPSLPMLKIPGKDGPLERIPSLSSRPTIHPIPSLAPLVQEKQGGNTEGGPRLPPAGPSGDPINPLKASTLAPLQHSNENQKSQEHGGSTLPSVAATLEDNGNGNGNRTTSESQLNNDTAIGTTETGKESKRDAEVEGKANGMHETKEAGNDNSSGHEDAKLLQSMALSTQGSGTEPKRSLLNATPLPVSSVSGTGASSSPPIPIPALPLPSIPRSVPAPRLKENNATNVNNVNNSELRLGPLGASSLTKLGRSNNPVPNTKLPTALPSPLAQPKHESASRSGSGLPSNSSALMASPLSSGPTSHKSNMAVAEPEAAALSSVPQSQSLPLPALPSLTGKRLNEDGNNDIANKNDTNSDKSNGKRNSSDKLPPLKNTLGPCSPQGNQRDNGNDGKKSDAKTNGADTSSSTLSKPTFGIPRSVPISSIAGMNDGNGNDNSNSGTKIMSAVNNGNNGTERKREVSPGAVDTDKRYKRPRVHESIGNEDGVERGRERRRGEENGERQNENEKMKNNSNSNSNRKSANGKEDGRETRMGSALHTTSATAPTPTAASGPHLPVAKNEPLPSFKSSRIKSVGLHLRSAPFKSQRAERCSAYNNSTKSEEKMDTSSGSGKGEKEGGGKKEGIRGDGNNKMKDEGNKNKAATGVPETNANIAPNTTAAEGTESASGTAS